MVKKKHPLTLHELLSSLSFWGTATRTMLFGFLAVATFLIALTEAANTSVVDGQFMLLIYVLSSFLVLDFGYVMIARAFKLNYSLDMLALTIAETLVAALYIFPKVVVGNENTTLLVDPLTYVIFIPLVVLALRLLGGFVFGKKA